MGGGRGESVPVKALLLKIEVVVKETFQPSHHAAGGLDRSWVNWKMY